MIGDPPRETKAKTFVGLIAFGITFAIASIAVGFVSFVFDASVLIKVYVWAKACFFLGLIMFGSFMVFVAVILRAIGKTLKQKEK